MRSCTKQRIRTPCPTLSTVQTSWSARSPPSRYGCLLHPVCLESAKKKKKKIELKLDHYLASSSCHPPPHSCTLLLTITSPPAEWPSWDWVSVPLPFPLFPFLLTGTEVASNLLSANVGVFIRPGVQHSVLRQVGEGLLSVRSGAGAPQAKAVYRGGERLWFITTNTHSHRSTPEA